MLTGWPIRSAIFRLGKAFVIGQLDDSALVFVQLSHGSVNPPGRIRINHNLLHVQKSEGVFDPVP